MPVKNTSGSKLSYCHILLAAHFCKLCQVKCNTLIRQASILPLCGGRTAVTAVTLRTWRGRTSILKTRCQLINCCPQRNFKTILFWTRSSRWRRQRAPATSSRLPRCCIQLTTGRRTRWELLLRYESSTLLLYKELSSTIFQSCEWVSESVRHR